MAASLKRDAAGAGSRSRVQAARGRFPFIEKRLDDEDLTDADGQDG